jgi:hypothetical protein
MAKIKVLIDTDIFIDYFNSGHLNHLFDSNEFKVYFSVITKKELLSKGGLKEADRQAILHTLKKHRIINLDKKIALRYSELRQEYPSLQKADALIAATALTKNLPLITRNNKHYKNIKHLILFLYPS